jgi:hypothetical protein
MCVWRPIDGGLARLFSGALRVMWRHVVLRVSL